MLRFFYILVLLTTVFLIACQSKPNDFSLVKKSQEVKPKVEVIIDCNYSFEEATAGTNAPKEVLNELTLIPVRYYSTDNKIHMGQLLTNKEIADNLIEIFDFILKLKFPIAHVIPIVKYDWDDNKSMTDNNSYSFCYRNTEFSKHAIGMAVDINPFFNPMRWKDDYKYRVNKPIGAVYNPARQGTFSASNPVVLEFEKHGFRWGHNFTTKFDDHHFEK